jgi:hypothetical protein
MASLALTAPAQAAPVGAYTTKGAYKFFSAPALHPPKLKLVTHKSGLATGDFLVANEPQPSYHVPFVGEGGPLMLDSNLRPVWVRGVGRKVTAADLQQETYQGSPVMLWWQGLVSKRGITTKGKVVVVNESYRTIATLKARRPWVISLHDASISGANIWVTVYRVVRNQHLKRYGGARKGSVYDVGVQEYNLKTGKLLKTWDALNPGHKANVPLKDSEQPPPHGGAWDAYHINSVQALPNGDLVVSMRNTEAVYLISPTNKILWRLGGKRSTFTFGPGAKFYWQHHAELVNPAHGGVGPNDELTVFNDNCCKLLPSGGFGPRNGPSAGMILRLNTLTKKAKLVAAYRHSPPLHAAFLGSMQLLPGGNAVVGWGSVFEPHAYFSEYSKSGKQLLDAQWPGKNQSYRALFTSTWVGTPYYPPAGAAGKSKGKTAVYASWNGATEVAKWQVFAGSTASKLKKVASKARSGFETTIHLSKSYKVYEVRAVDSHGHLLPHGTSKTFS